MPTNAIRLEATRLIGQAMELQLASDGGGLVEIESLLERALDLWKDNLDGLEETAHFYDAVADDNDKAVHYARLCRDHAAMLVARMDEILADRIN